LQLGPFGVGDGKGRHGGHAVAPRRGDGPPSYANN
jgi:hypothetical protein